MQKIQIQQANKAEDEIIISIDFGTTTCFAACKVDHLKSTIRAKGEVKAAAIVAEKTTRTAVAGDTARVETTTEMATIEATTEIAIDTARIAKIAVETTKTEATTDTTISIKATGTTIANTIMAIKTAEETKAATIGTGTDATEEATGAINNDKNSDSLKENNTKEEDNFTIINLNKSFIAPGNISIAPGNISDNFNENINSNISDDFLQNCSIPSVVFFNTKNECLVGAYPESQVEALTKTQVIPSIIANAAFSAIADVASSAISNEDAVTQAKIIAQTQVIYDSTANSRDIITIRSIKRTLGHTLKDLENQEELKYFFNISNPDNSYIRATDNSGKAYITTTSATAIANKINFAADSCHNASNLDKTYVTDIVSTIAADNSTSAFTTAAATTVSAAHAAAPNININYVPININNNQVISNLEIISNILREVKNRADHEMQNEVKKVILTCPVYFDERAKAELKFCAEQVGLQVLKIIPEPVAAIYNSTLEAGIYLVFDIGGGTFDLSIIQVYENMYRVLINDGDRYTGGDQIDIAILEAIKRRYSHAFLNKISNNDQIKLARKIKEYICIKDEDFILKYDSNNHNINNNNNISNDNNLSNDNNISNHMENQKDIRLIFTKEELSCIISEFIKKPLIILQKMLKQSKKQDKIDGIIFVGSTTKIKQIQENVAVLLPKSKIYISKNPDQSVALGAIRHIYSDHTTLFQVSPLSLGIEVMGGVNEKIIERNSQLPSTVRKVFTNYSLEQNKVTLNILEGEREVASECKSLGIFKIDIPRSNPGTVKIEVIFSLDFNAELLVTAIVNEKEKTFFQYKPFSNINLEREIYQSIINHQHDLDAKEYAEVKTKAEILLNNLTNLDKLNMLSKFEIDLLWELRDTLLKAQQNQTGKEKGTEIRTQIETQIKSGPLPQAQSEIQTQAQPQAETQIQAQTQPQAETETQVKTANHQTEPQAETEIQVQTQAQTQPETEIQPQAQPQAETEIQVQTQAQTQPETEIQPQAQSQMETEIQVQTQAQPESQQQSQLESQSSPPPQTQLKLRELINMIQIIINKINKYYTEKNM